MTKLIEALKDNNYKIISYTDQFGQGKTTKLKEMMKDENYKNDFEFVLYDSFKYEWAGNKKITFIYEILNEIGFNKKMNDKDEGIKSKVEKIWEKIKSINVTFGYTYHNHAFSMSLSSKEKSPTFIENEIRNYISQNEQLDSFKSGLGEYMRANLS